jgi:hypothetical protein
VAVAGRILRRLLVFTEPSVTAVLAPSRRLAADFRTRLRAQYLWMVRRTALEY